MIRENKRGHRTIANSELHEAMFLRTIQEQAGYHVPWLLIAIGLGGLWYALCGYVL
jgi:hypothetical protein